MVSICVIVWIYIIIHLGYDSPISVRLIISEHGSEKRHLRMR